MFGPYQIKPKLGTNVLQILHGHSTGFHFLISYLKPSKDLLFVISARFIVILAGICFQIFGFDL